MLQPLDAGIIAAFKVKYRRKYVRFLINSYEKNITETPKLDMLSAIRFVINSWNEVTVETVINCWRKTKLIDINCDAVNDNNIDLNLLIEDLTKLRTENIMDANEYINIPEERETEQVMSVEDIISGQDFINLENESSDDDTSDVLEK
ncbi:Pdc2p-like protein, partial [Leptotrombidium deliense]